MDGATGWGQASREPCGRWKHTGGGGPLRRAPRGRAVVHSRRQSAVSRRDRRDTGRLGSPRGQSPAGRVVSSRRGTAGDRRPRSRRGKRGGGAGGRRAKLHVLPTGGARTIADAG